MFDHIHYLKFDFASDCPNFQNQLISCKIQHSISVYLKRQRRIVGNLVLIERFSFQIQEPCSIFGTSVVSNHSRKLQLVFYGSPSRKAISSLCSYLGKRQSHLKSGGMQQRFSFLGVKNYFILSYCCC